MGVGLLRVDDQEGAVVAMADHAKVGRPPGRYFAAAPTREQAKRIWWNDLKALIRPRWKAKVSETDLYIRTTLGNEIWVIGLDKPQRMEGVPWDGGIIDEYADCKPGTFDANIRPAGRAWLRSLFARGQCWSGWPVITREKTL